MGDTRNVGILGRWACEGVSVQEETLWLLQALLTKSTAGESRIKPVGDHTARGLHIWKARAVAG